MENQIDPQKAAETVGGVKEFTNIEEKSIPG